MDEPWLRDVLALLPSGAPGTPIKYAAAEFPAEGISIAAAIGYAARCGALRDVGESYRGPLLVAAKILSLDYLWNSVRVKGGAYGVNMSVSMDGNVSFTSYRDPHCSDTLDIFSAAGAALRAFAGEGEEPDKYIISTIGGLEPLTTPRQDMARAANMYFIGYGDEFRQRIRREVLHTTLEELAAVADSLDALSRTYRTCVIGGGPILEDCGGKIDSVTPLQQ